MKTSTKIVRAILEELCDRRGIRQSIEGIDKDTMEELKSTLVSIVEEIIANDTNS